MTVITATFNYDSLPAEVAANARTAAVNIRNRLRAAYVDTGRDLVGIKARLPHGQFSVWLKAEFGMTERTAENYMNATRFLEGKSEKISDLPQSAIFAMAAPSAPSNVVVEILAATEADQAPPVHQIKNRIRDALEDIRRAEAEAAKSDQQRQKEKRQRESKEARLLREKAENAAAKHEEEKKISIWRTEHSALAEKLRAVLSAAEIKQLSLITEAGWPLPREWREMLTGEVESPRSWGYVP